MEFILPMSPSVNAMYRHHGHITYKTKEAKDWIATCKKIVKVKKTMTGEVDVDVRFFFKRERDLDNSLKSLIDLMQECRVIENDSQVYSLLATKDFDKKNPHVEIDIRENS